MGLGHKRLVWKTVDAVIHGQGGRICKNPEMRRKKKGNRLVAVYGTGGAQISSKCLRRTRSVGREGSSAEREPE